MPKKVPRAWALQNERLSLYSFKQGLRRKKRFICYQSYPG